MNTRNSVADPKTAKIGRDSIKKSSPNRQLATSSQQHRRNISRLETYSKLQEHGTTPTLQHPTVEVLENSSQGDPTATKDAMDTKEVVMSGEASKEYKI